MLHRNVRLHLKESRELCSWAVALSLDRGKGWFYSTCLHCQSYPSPSHPLVFGLTCISLHVMLDTRGCAGNHGLAASLGILQRDWICRGPTKHHSICSCNQFPALKPKPQGLALFWQGEGPVALSHHRVPLERGSSLPPWLSAALTLPRPVGAPRALTGRSGRRSRGGDAR